MRPSERRINHEFNVAYVKENTAQLWLERLRNELRGECRRNRESGGTNRNVRELDQRKVCVIMFLPQIFLSLSFSSFLSLSLSLSLSFSLSSLPLLFFFFL